MIGVSLHVGLGNETFPIGYIVLKVASNKVVKHEKERNKGL